MKKFPNSILQDLLNRKSIILILALIAFIVFRIQIWKLYNEKIVGGILSNIETHWLLDILCLTIISFSVIATIHFIRINKRMTNSFFFSCLFIFLLFIYCSYFSGKYTFKSFEWIPSIRYIDCLLLLFCCILFVQVASLVNTNKEPAYQNSPFLIDKPIETATSDKFSRSVFAKRIAEKIQSKLQVEDAGALAIGINGPWGSGKTSFTNMIKESIDLQNRIVIDFNPWRSSSSSRIIEDFFELLIAEMRPHDPSLSNTIASYAKTLTKIEENILTKSTEVISELLFDEKNKNEVYDSINTSIKKIKKQIFIFIDDLDRLDKKEVIEVLRLIRNTANFSNVVYIVSYDKGYIQVAIKDFNEYNFKSFLEKIFQFEFTLPMYEQSVLRTEVKDLLKIELEEKYHKHIDRVVDSREYYGINFTNEVIKTYRDVIRFVNALLFEINTIKEEVFFYDFYLLQLLKLEYPKVYEALIDNRYLFFTKDGEHNLYRLKTEKEEWTSDDVLSFSKAFKNTSWNQSDSKEENKVSSFEKYLIDNSDFLVINNYDKNLLKFMVDTLLTLKETKNTEDDAELYKSFAYPENFHKYFAFRLYEGDISAKEFEDFRRMDFEQYKEKVLKWLSQGKTSALFDRLEKVREFSTIIEFENQVKILFELGRLEVQKGNPYWYDYSKVIRTLRYPLRYSPRIKQLNLYSSEEEYKNFYVSLLKTAPQPPIFESHLNARLIVSDIEFVISKEELSEINLQFFKNYCAQTTTITSEFWQLYNNSKIESGEVEESINPIARQIAIENFKEKVHECDLGRFIKQTNPGSLYYNLAEEAWSFAFETIHELENWFKTSDSINRDSDCFKEFYNFYKETKEKDFKPVVFDFKLLAPVRYI